MNITPVYDLPTNTTGVMGLMEWFNTVTGGIFWIAFLLIFFIIAYVSMSRYIAGKAFIGASATTALVSIPLAAAGLIDSKIPIALLLFTAAVTFFIHYKKTRSL